MTNKQILRYKNIVADALNSYKWLHNGKRPQYIAMTLELYKIVTGERIFKNNSKIYGVNIKLIEEKGRKFYLIEQLYDVDVI